MPHAAAGFRVGAFEFRVAERLPGLVGRFCGTGSPAGSTSQVPGSFRAFLEEACALLANFVRAVGQERFAALPRPCAIASVAAQPRAFA